MRALVKSELSHQSFKLHFLFVMKASSVMFGIRQNGAGAGGFSSTQGQRLFCISNLESMHCLLWGGSWGNKTSWAITKSPTYTWTGHKQHLTVSQIHLSSLCWSSFSLWQHAHGSLMDHFQIESTVNVMLTNKAFLHPGPNNSSHSD